MSNTDLNPDNRSQHPDEIDRKEVKQSSTRVKEDLNADPLTGEPGSHPVGTGIGTLGGATAGAAIGSMGGPLGTLIGGVVGGVAGAVAGHASGELVSPTEEESYWREHSARMSYYNHALNYDLDYKIAYQLGYENRLHYDDNISFEEAENELKSKWEQIKGRSRLTWEEARWAAKDAWERIEKR